MWMNVNYVLFEMAQYKMVSLLINSKMRKREFSTGANEVQSYLLIVPSQFES